MSDPNAPEKKPLKTRGKSLSAKQRHELITAIVNADPNEPDRALAATLSAKFGHPVQSGTVAKYRKEFGIEPVKMPKAKDIAAQLAAARARIAELEHAQRPEAEEQHA